MNLVQLIFDNAALYPDKPAVIFEGATYTYAGLAREVRRYAALLAGLGVKKGDRVALQLPKCMEFIFLHLANLSLGAATLPLNPAYSAGEVTYFLEDSESSLFFADARQKEKLKTATRTVFIEESSGGGLSPLVNQAQEAPKTPEYPTGPEDTALLCYTSGTTGRPKAAMITHRNLISNTRALQQAWRWTGEDILLHVLPLFHIHGLCVALHGSLSAGSTLVMHRKFDPLHTLKALEENNCTLFMAVPTIYYRLMEAWPKAKPDLSSMRVFISGSAPLSRELFQEFHAATGFRIMERYGMTETQMIASNPYEPESRVPGSVGFPLPGIQIRVVSGEDVKPGEIGEVWVKGENVFKGYWKMPEKTREAFSGEWFQTGDLGYRDETQRLYLSGRMKELIITGGYNVYPKEVEDIINQHPGVRESAVIGLKDPEFGETVAAAVVKKEGSPVTGEELMAYCKTNIAGYKCPKKVLFIRELPRNAMGKVQKHLIEI